MTETAHDPFAALEEAARRQAALEQAARALARGNCRLILGRDVPSAFFSTLALGLVPGEDWDCPTLATDGRHLKYNPDFINGLTPDEVLGVVVHEVMHTALCHHVRRGGRDPARFNVACVLPGTRIRMADGSEKPVQEVMPGERILGVDSGHLVEAEVLATVCKRTTELVHFHHHSEAYVTTSGDHCFLTEYGYVEARELCAWPRETRYVYRLRAGVCGRELDAADDCRDGKIAQPLLPECGQTPLPPGPVRAAEDPEAARSRHIERPQQRRTGVHCGPRGWGGDCHHRQPPGREEEQVLSPAERLDHQHQPASARLAEREGLQLQPDQEPGGSGLLADRVERAWSDGRTPGYAPLLGHQEGSCVARDGVRQPPAGAATQGLPNAADARDCCDDQAFELASVTLGHWQVEPHIVYDLSTACHSFIANGFVVHNCDLAVNPTLLEAGFHLPKGRLLPGEGPYQQLPPGLSAEEYYARLPGGGGPEEPGAGTPDPGGCGGVTEPGDGSAADLRQARAEQEVALAQAARVARGRGQLPAGLDRLVAEALTPQVDWREVLREFVQRLARNDYAWLPPNKRFIHQGIYLPGLRSEELGDVVVAVDTSGSIGEAELSLFAGELQAILDAYEVSLTVLYHDSQVQHVQRWTSSDGPLVLEARGGGGTDHCPVFAWLAEQEEPACVVCLTDMESRFPEHGPDCPVLWCSTSKGKVAPFGQLVEVGP